MFLLTESPLLPPPPHCVTDRGQEACHVFPEQERWADLHLLSHFLSNRLHFRLFCLFLFFVSPLYYVTALAVLAMLYLVIQWQLLHNCTNPTYALIKGCWSEGCFVILNFSVLNLLQRLLSGYTFTLFDGKINFEAFFPAHSAPSKPLCPPESESMRVFDMSCVLRRATASQIAKLLVLVTTRRKVPPHWGGWLDRLPFCPVTDTLHMCHSFGPVTSPEQKGWDGEREWGRRRQPGRSRRQRCQPVYHHALK